MFPTQIILRNVRPSTELSSHVRDLCDKLSHVHPGILNCRVSIEQALAKSRRRTPHPEPFFVDVQVRVQGQQLNGQSEANLQLETALRKAFVLVRRQLREAHDQMRIRSSERAGRVAVR